MLNHILRMFFPKGEIRPDDVNLTQEEIEEYREQFSSLWNDFDKRSGSYYSTDYTNQYSMTLWAKDPRLANWLGTIHVSGYIREKSLRSLIKYYQPGDENRILLRLSDWVPEVQVVAQQWVLNNFKSLPIEMIKENDQLILYLS
jgi:hypothetical protein